MKCLKTKGMKLASVVLALAVAFAFSPVVGKNLSAKKKFTLKISNEKDFTKKFYLGSAPKTIIISNEDKVKSVSYKSSAPDKVSVDKNGRV